MVREKVTNIAKHVLLPQKCVNITSENPKCKDCKKKSFVYTQNQAGVSAAIQTHHLRKYYFIDLRTWHNMCGLSILIVR